MVKIKLSALACAILVGGQQLVAEDLNDIPVIDLGTYWDPGYTVHQPVDIDNEKTIITGDPEDAIINVDNNGELISRVTSFVCSADINIKNNSKVIFEYETTIQNPHFRIINNSTAVYNNTLGIFDGDSWPVIEEDNDFSGGAL